MSDYKISEKILNDLNAERIYQLTKAHSAQSGGWTPEFDDQNTATDWIAFITHYAGRAYTFFKDPVYFRKYMVKVAALAIAAIESIDRKQDTASSHWQKGVKNE